MIKYLIMDVDGTLTDGKIIMGESGELGKAFHVKDGYGIQNILPPNHIEPVILTGRKSLIVENRCKELGIQEIYQKVEDKACFLKNFIEDKGICMENLAYIGDDLNDLEAMQLIKKEGGITGSPRDAVPKVKEAADFVCSKEGGSGAVREFIEHIVGRINKIYIAGAHSRGRTLRAYLEYLYPDIQVEAFLVDDMGENGENVDGVRVQLIDDKLHVNYPVYIGTRRVNHKKLTEELKAAGMKEIIPLTVELDMHLRNEFVRKYLQKRGRKFQLIDDWEVAEYRNMGAV